MLYLDFLQRLHADLAPATYLEVGIRNGVSLSLATAPRIGIDPAYSVTAELAGDVHLFRTTSDEYFQRDEPLAPFAGAPVEMSFIDGMHLFEYALRDFANVERLSRWTGVAIFDDMLPRTISEAARDRHTMDWAGDVYKVIPTLAELRPDLVMVQVGTMPTGLVIVLGLDPDSTVLTDRYDEIEQRYVVPDPQAVPEELLLRSRAVDPEQLLQAPFWKVLKELRASGAGREEGLADLRAAVESGVADLTRVPPPPIPNASPWPPVKGRPAPGPTAAAGPAGTPAAKPSAPPRPRWRREASRLLRDSSVAFADATVGHGNPSVTAG